MPTTTPCARASSPPSNASSWNAVGSPLRPKRRWLVLALSKAGTTPSGCIPHWATARPWPTKLPWRHSQPNRNHPSPPTLHENGSTSNILLDMWEKFVMITALAGMNCLMRGSVGEIMGTEDGESLMLELLAECQAVAAASGYAPRRQHREQCRAMLTE